MLVPKLFEGEWLRDLTALQLLHHTWRLSLFIAFSRLYDSYFYLSVHINRGAHLDWSLDSTEFHTFSSRLKDR